MGPSEDTWGDGGSYDSYSLSRDLAANETLQLYSPNVENMCIDVLYHVSGLKAGCYQTQGSGEMVSCIEMTTTPS